MSVLDYLVNSLMTVVLIVGSYQFYFFLQRRHARKPIEFYSRIDELIPFRPGWVWVYTALYYPVILLGVLTIGSFAQFNYTAFSFLMLLRDAPIFPDTLAAWLRWIGRLRRQFLLSGLHCIGVVWCPCPESEGPRRAAT
jgi:hypothetical protein